MRLEKKLFLLFSFFILLPTMGISSYSLAHEIEDTKSPGKVVSEIFKIKSGLKYDWVRLKLGELIRGEITSLERDKLYFDSDELNELEIDWDDVTELYSGRTNRCVFKGRRVAIGRIHILDDVVMVNGAKEEKYKRDDLLYIFPGEKKELNFWSAKVTLGGQFRGGNSTNIDLSSTGNIMRRTPFTRMIVNYNLAFGKANGVLNSSNVNAQGKYDVFLTYKFFITPFLLQYYRDPFQNIDHRILPGAGIGYEFFNRDDFKWNATTGGGYRYEKFSSVLPGTPTDNSTGAFILGSKLAWDIAKDIETSLFYNFQQGIPDGSERSHHINFTVSFELTKIFDFDLTFIWDHVANPRINSMGVTPKSSDFQLIFGLGIDVH